MIELLEYMQKGVTVIWGCQQVKRTISYVDHWRCAYPSIPGGRDAVGGIGGGMTWWGSAGSERAFHHSHSYRSDSGSQCGMRCYRC